MSIGPLKAVRFRRAKTRPGVGDGNAPKAALPSLAAAAKAEEEDEDGDVRARRMFDGKAVAVVGVAGRILMLLCGLRLRRARLAAL